MTSAIAAIRAQWANNTDAKVLDNLFGATSGWQGVHGGYLTYLQSVANQNTIEQVNDDTPLSSKSVNSALTTLISQMKANTESVNRPTTTKTITPWASNKTDAKMVISLKNEFGDPLDCIYPETLTFTCVSDVSTGSTLYSESFTVSGPPSLPVYDVNWPQGSGASGSFQLQDAVLTNYIQNGGFKNFTVANTPDNWTIRVGSAGSTILQTATAKRGTSALQFVSDGSTLTAVKQQLSTSLVKPNQVICINTWMKMSASDSSGVVTIKLTDGAGTTLTDDAGTSLATNFDTNTQIGTSYTNISTSFSTPRQLPTSGVWIDIGFSTSPASPKTLSIDLVGVSKGQQLYPQGPYVQMYSTAAASALKDYFTVALTNDATNATWVRFGQRVLGMPNLGNSFYFPSAASETIPDSLLT